MSGDYKVGDLVISTTGRDKDRCYLVLTVDEASRLGLVDGRVRRVENPKQKNSKHVKHLNLQAEELASKIAAGGIPSNLEVRKVITELTANLGED
ncbi:MAG: RNA-binding protein [Firmicutes bacterium]|nr:RNA-binding protein [Bacillota bacterium]